VKKIVWQQHLKSLSTVRSAPIYLRLSLLFLVFAYGIGIFPSLIWNEEYPGILDPYTYSLDQFRDGRPIYGITTQIFIGIAQLTGLLWPYRLFGFIGFICWALYIGRTIHRTDFENKAEITFASLIAFTLPAFQTLLNSGNLAIYSWSSLFACMAYTHLSHKRYAQALILVVVSLLMYPVSTLFIFSFAFLSIYLSKKRSNLDFILGIKKLLLLLLTGGVFSSLIAFAILKYVFGIPPTSRVGVVSLSEFLPNLEFFVTRFVPTNASLFIYSSHSTQSAVLVTLVFILLITLMWRTKFTHPERDLSSLFFLFIYAFFACSISLFAKSREIDVRFIRNSTWLLCIFLVYKFLVALKYWGLGNRILKVTPAAMVILALFAITESNYRYFYFFKTPYDQKTAYINKELNQCRSEQIANGVNVRMPIEDFPRHNNIGTYSLKTDLSQGWVPLANIKLLAKAKAGIDIVVNFEGDFSEKNTNRKCLVDLSKYRP
jgi:hypothetical protein